MVDLTKVAINGESDRVSQIEKYIDSTDRKCINHVQSLINVNDIDLSVLNDRDFVCNQFYCVARRDDRYFYLFRYRLNGWQISELTDIVEDDDDQQYYQTVKVGVILVDDVDNSVYLIDYNSDKVEKYDEITKAIQHIERINH